MDPRLLEYYNRELQFVREMGSEFAQSYPRIAARLGLEGLECADPYVERLIESVAFLTARVQLKLDARHPDFTQHLLGLVYPQFLSPVPACAIVELAADLKEGSLERGHTIPRGTSLRTPLGKGDRTACEFRTAQPVTLWPIEVVEAKYLAGAGAMAARSLAGEGSARAAIRLRLKTAQGVKFKNLPIETLTFFIKATPDIAARLQEQILADCVGLQGRCVRSGMPTAFRPASSIRAVGLEDDEALLPATRRGFQGYRLLQEYCAFAERFLFFELRDFHSVVASCEGDELELYLAMNRVQPALENALDASHFRLGCVPVVNLFPRRTDRIHVTAAETEMHLVPDRNRPMDFEVFGIDRLQAIGAGGETITEVLPFYAANHASDASKPVAYYTMQRRPRLLSTRQQNSGARAGYVGSECFVSIVDTGKRHFTGDIRQLEADVLCTNRDLPIQLALGSSGTDLTIEGGAPVQAIRCISGPSYPRPSPAFGDNSWKLISHLALNYLSLTDQDPEGGAQMLRGMLALYADSHEAALARQIEGIRSVEYRPVVRRVPGSGPTCYARGLEITVKADDAAFEGVGLMPLGGVLERFLARYASINSFTQLRLHSSVRGEIKSWPVRVGCRQSL